MSSLRRYEILALIDGSEVPPSVRSEKKVRYDTVAGIQIAPYWKGRLAALFCLGVPAYRLRFQVPLDPKTVRRWFREMKELFELSGEIEMDETMFSGRVSGKRGWGAAGKRMVFGLYQCNGKVLVFPITSRGKGEFISLMTGHTQKGKPRGRDHLNGIEGFWSCAKHWLCHYRGVPRENLHLYLKEIEWRFNHRSDN